MPGSIFDDDTHSLTPEEAYSPTYWCGRAAQARSMARMTHDGILAGRLLRAAGDYDRLAERAAAILRAEAAA